MAPRFHSLALLACALVACNHDVPTGRRCTSSGRCGIAGDRSESNDAIPNAAPNDDPSTTTDAAGRNQQELSVHVENVERMTIEVVTLTCAGECAVVEAVARGGNPPYAFRWDDGSTEAKRRVCLGATSTLQVTVMDTAIEAVELGYEAQSASAFVTAQVLDCSDEDGGSCLPGPGPQTPTSGRYEGSGTYRCDNDMDPNVANLINNGQITLDLAIDPARAEQTGHVYFQWGLVVIVGTGKLQGALGCGGAYEGVLVEGVWGLPGADPLSVIPTGVCEGDVFASATGPGTVQGIFHWKSYLPDGTYGNDCVVSYEGKLAP